MKLCLYFSGALNEDPVMRVSVLALAIPALLLGCSATGGGSMFGSGGGSSNASGNGTGGDTGAGGTNFTGGPGSGSATGGNPEFDEVFSHSPDVLFRLDPITKQITTIGPFTGYDNSGMIDIAIDKNGAMFGTSFGGLYKIDKTNAKCTLVATGAYPNSLSFVPKGTVDPNDEALVGFNGATYVRINTTTGQVSNIGGIGGNGYMSSGDVVSVIGGGTYLTVTGGNCNDCIVEVDPATGALVKFIGPIQHAEVYGLAFWGGAAYGFAAGGVLFQIDLTTGSTMDIPFPNAPPNLVFFGAGSSTSVPVTPPK